MWDLETVLKESSNTPPLPGPVETVGQDAESAGECDLKHTIGGSLKCSPAPEPAASES